MLLDLREQNDFDFFKERIDTFLKSTSPKENSFQAVSKSIDLIKQTKSLLDLFESLSTDHLLREFLKIQLAHILCNEGGFCMQTIERHESLEEPSEEVFH